MREILLDDFKTAAIVQNVKHLFVEEFDLKAWEHPEFHRISLKFAYKGSFIYTSTPLYEAQKYAINCLSEILIYDKYSFDRIDFSDKEKLKQYLNCQLGHMIVHHRELYEEVLRNVDSYEIIESICSKSNSPEEALNSLHKSFLI